MRPRRRPNAGRTPSTPVPAFAQPVLVLDTPAALAQLSDAGIAHYAGQDLTTVAQGDAHLAAAHTASQVSGRSTSLYAHQGGIQIKAAEGPVSLRAHTDTLSLLADQEIQILSVGDEVTITAKSRIAFTGGDSSIVLDGADITFTTPGTWTAKGGFKEFVGGARGEAEIPALPQGLATEAPREIELHFDYDDLRPVAGAPYKLTFDDGTVLQGTLDAQGFKLLSGVPAGAYTVEYGEDAATWSAPPLAPDATEFAQADVQRQGRTTIERMLAATPTSQTPSGAAP